MIDETMMMTPIVAGGPMVYMVNGVLIFCIGGLHSSREEDLINEELKTASLASIVLAQARYGCLISTEQLALYSQSNRVIFDHLRVYHDHVLGPHARLHVPFVPRKPKGFFRDLSVLARSGLRQIKRKFKHNSKPSI